jgi:hypothetical protein
VTHFSFLYYSNVRVFYYYYLRCGGCRPCDVGDREAKKHTEEREGRGREDVSATVLKERAMGRTGQAISDKKKK